MAKIITSKPEVLWNLKCTLGEGTLWVKEHNSIYFTDIKKKRIHILNLKNKKKETIKVNKEIGFLAHIKNNIFIFFKSCLFPTSKSLKSCAGVIFTAPVPFSISV